jgi:4-diphosphocytidyl-2-C-methyl-D-erythritol kinase
VAAPSLVEHAPAKVNLTLHVTGRRRDGYHTLESLVIFASIGDRLSLRPGSKLGLTTRGRFAAACGASADNLVLRAARMLAAQVPGIRSGHFTLTKNLPVAAGLGGGSSDAAAALRLLARANGIALTDRRLLKVARWLGADVPVCLDPRARTMRGIGELLSAPRKLPRLAAVLVNPGVALATAKVFARFDRSQRGRSRAGRSKRVPTRVKPLLDYAAAGGNDLEPAAIALSPKVAVALEALRATPGCRLARMTGSGATCFGVFGSRRAATAAARRLAAQHRRWWVHATVLR